MRLSFQIHPASKPVLDLKHTALFLSPLIVQAKHMVNHFHCYAVDHRGAGDSELNVPDRVIAEATADIDMMEEWRRPSANLPTLEGFAEDICAIAKHLSWKGNHRVLGSASTLFGYCS